MSAWFLWAVGILYLGASVAACFEGKGWLALVLVCYAIANYGFIRMAQ